jgi:two-component system, sensor histidine kinase and response regulator
MAGVIMEYTQTFLVILIEDSKEDAELIQLNLERAGDIGIEIIYAYTREEGLRYILEHKEKLALILTDLKLPDSHELEIVEMIVAIKPESVPLVVVTAADIAIVGVQVIRLGAQDCISKTRLFEERSLIRTVLFAIEREKIRAKEKTRARKLQNELDSIRGVIDAPIDSDGVARARAALSNIEKIYLPAKEE